MEDGPLMSAMHHRLVSLQPGLETMSTEDMRHLLILMGTITVISFVLVVSIVSILIAFIWYTRTRMCSARCACSLEGRNHNKLESGRVDLLPSRVQSGGRFQPNPDHTLVHQSCNSHYQVMRPNSPFLQLQRRSLAGTPIRTVPQARAPAGFNSVIVNPLPPTHSLDLVPLNHKTYTLYTQADDVERPSKKPDLELEEPIYQEIKPKIDPEEKSGVGGGGEQEPTPPQGRKKEIEYWQITAKEVVKFRPCTETFINRA